MNANWYLFDKDGKQLTLTQISIPSFIPSNDDYPVTVILRPCTGGVLVKVFERDSNYTFFQQVVFEGKIAMLAGVVIVARRFDLPAFPGAIFATWVKKATPMRWYGGIVTELAPSQISKELERLFPNSSNPLWIERLKEFSRRLADVYSKKAFQV